MCLHKNKSFKKVEILKLVFTFFIIYSEDKKEEY